MNRSPESFDERVWSLTSRIPRGRVTTYRILAEQLGTKAYRAIGNALHRNPHAPQVPCHRVVKSNGEVGGFASGTAEKIRMLRAEGIEISGGRVVEFENLLFRFRDKTINHK